MRVSGSFLFDTAAQPNQAQPCRGRPWPGLGRPTAFQRTCSKFEECTFRPTCPATRPSPAQQPSPAQNKTSPAWPTLAQCTPWPAAGNSQNCFPANLPQIRWIHFRPFSAGGQPNLLQIRWIHFRPFSIRFPANFPAISPAQTHPEGREKANPANLQQIRLWEALKGER